MKNRRVFVSGGAGVIGLEMIPRLCERGATVMVGDLKPRPASFDPAVIYRQGDLNDLGRQELAAFAPDVLIHLAATFERSTETYGFWEENFWHNVRLSHHLMTIAKDLPTLRRVVFASSYLIYDPALYQFDAARRAPVSLQESDPVAPRNLTGMAKFAHEIELRFLEGFRANYFTSVCARIFRGYGCSSRDVISRWIRAALRDEPITLFRPEGMFDYVYAADSAEGLIRLAEVERLTGVINLGTGRSRRVQDVIDILRIHFPGLKVVGADSDIPYEASQADTTLLRSRLGWVPEHDLERALPKMIAYERDALLQAPAKSVNAPVVLVTSASKKVPLIRAMQAAARQIHPQSKVIAGDVDARALTVHVADAFWRMPRLAETDAAYLLRECASRGITHIMPTRDAELSFWAANAASFHEAGIEVIVSPLASITRCVDKLLFWQFGRERGLPFIPTSVELDELKSSRYVVKERYGAGSRNLHLDVDRAAAVAIAGRLQAPVFQPYVEGMEISIDAWMDRHCAVKGLVLRRREQVHDGESQVTRTFRDAGIEAQALRSLEALQLRGPAVMQAIVDDAATVHVIECNARFGGASTAGIAAGLNGLYWSLLEGQGASVSGCEFHRVAGEIRQVRVPCDLHVHDPDL